MPRTTLALRTLRARPRLKKNPGSTRDVHGHHLLEHLGAYIHQRSTDPINDVAKERYLRVKYSASRGHSLTLFLESGTYGEAGSTYHVRTHQVTHERTELEASTLETRMVVWAPPGADILSVAIEMKSGALHGGYFLDAFRQHMLERFDDFFFPSETVMEKDAWSAAGNLTEVSVVQHRQILDASTGIDSDRSNEFLRGSVAHTALPPKGVHHWPQQVWDALRNRQIEAATFIGLRRNDDTDATGPDEEVFVTVERGGRQKRFALGTDGVPSIRLELTTDGEPALMLPDFYREVDDAVEQFYEDLELSWSRAWAHSTTGTDWLAHRW